MVKILILIGGHLCTAPRPQKEAETLANAGHDVTVRGFWFDPELVKRERKSTTKNATVTNKLFQYLQAGLAVIATDTAGQREILSQRPAISHLIPNNDPVALAQALKELLYEPEKLTTAKVASLQAAKAQLCWDKQVRVLLQTTNFAFNGCRKD